MKVDAIRRRAFVVWIICVLSIMLSQSSAASNGWTRVRTKHLLVVGDAPEGEMRRIAMHLEGLHAAFARLFGAHASADRATPTIVVAFRDETSYESFKPLHDGQPAPEVAGHFQPDEEVNYIAFAVNRPDGRSALQIAAHEYVHLLARANFGAAPVWFEEGFAEYYSTLQLAKSDRILFGKKIEGRTQTLRHAPLLPIETLLNADRYSTHYTNPHERAIFYAQSWALIHYLLTDHTGARQTQLKRYLELSRGGALPEDAFRRAFDTTYAAFGRELSGYIAFARYREQSVFFDEPLEPVGIIESALLTRAEIQARLGDLLVRAERFDEAEQRLARAASLDPAYAPVHVSLGLLRLRQQRFGDARRHLEQALALNTRDHLAHYYYAAALSRDTSDADSTISGYVERTALLRQELRAAINVAPNFLAAYRLLAEMELARGTELSEAIALLHRATTLAPARTDLKLLLARLHLRKEEHREARLLLDELDREGSAPRTREEARNIKVEIVAREEETARRQEQPDSTLAEFAWRPVALPCDMPQPGPYRKPLRFKGEQKCGRLVSVECLDRGVLLVIETEAGTLRLRADVPGRVRFVTYTVEERGAIECGKLRNTPPVLVTYHAAKREETTGHDGEAVAVEFVPADWQR